MYEWLTDALQGPSTVITANRRLARALHDEFARQQVRAGKQAWESPAIHSWQDWLDMLLLGATDQASLPTRITPHQSRLLWERCLSRETGVSRSGLAALVRLSRDAWQRLADWQVSIGEVARSAQSIDQRMFAAAAGRYLGILEREHWVDDAGLASLVDELIRTGRASSAGSVTFAGFDRERPVVTSIIAALAERDCEIRPGPLRKSADSVGLQCFETTDAEIRAAGAWAREQREKHPDYSIAIIAGNLEKEAIHKAHLVREGLVPGWQYGPPSIAHSVNVSYGRKLADFPAVSIALLLLRWLVGNLSAGEIGQLLRTPLLGSPSTGTRSRLELRLRRLPDRNWSPAMLSGALRGREDDNDAADWLRLVGTITKLRRELQRSASPADWAVYIDNVLKVCAWPGNGPLSSSDFQLVNRWRDLLNDLARLALVSPLMTLNTAIRRLELMAADTVFQPESEGGAVQLIGPLEASGAQFDAVWISGLTAADWPPPGNPSPMLSRRLQRQKGMPDAEPSDTVEYAQSLLLNLGSSANLVVCSYAQTQDDAEQKPSELLQALSVAPQTAQSDPGWHATTLARISDTSVVSDSVPQIYPGEHVSGGAGTLQRQLTDPIAAFVVGRLGVKTLQPQAVGLPASLRGSIIHDALYRLYSDTPSSADISGWPDHEMAARTEKALNFAFARHERDTDTVLKELFRLERHRIDELLQKFVSVDLARGDFTIAAVEHVVAFAEAGVRLELRVDRIDRMRDGTVAVLDYKTGAKRKFLQSDGQPKEIQLIAYACALDAPVSALALVNVDSREISFDGAGQGYTDSAEWSDTIANWKRSVVVACEDLSRGDVRINRAQGIKDARSFNLLSRYTELRRDG
jgi:probable DNA repair protein